MAISGQGGIQGGLGSQGGSGAAGALEAFLRLRNNSREKFALPEIPAKVPANTLAKTTPKAPVQESVSAFAEAKAGLLKMAGQYQRNGAAEKIQQGPKLGQIVDFRA